MIRHIMRLPGRRTVYYLLPRATGRQANLWKVPRKSKGASYGFGQSNVWFAQGREKNEYLNRFLERVIAQIEAYDGETVIAFPYNRLLISCIRQPGIGMVIYPCNQVGNKTTTA